MPLQRVAVAYGAWIVLLAAVAAAVRPLQPSMIVLAGLTGSIVMGYGIRRHRPVRRWPWYCLVTALLLNAAGQAISWLLPGPPGMYRPGSPAVYGVLFAMSVFMIVGVIGLARPAPRDLTAVVDVAILVLGTGLLVGVLIAVPFALTPDLPGLQAAARIFFVARDVLLLAATIHMATSQRWNGALGLLVAGIASLLTSDVLFSLATVRGDVAEDNATELGWLAFAGAWGLAALLPSMRDLGQQDRPSRRSIPLRLSLLAVASILPVTLLLLTTYQKARPWYEPLVATVSAIMLALVLAQLVGVAVNLRNQVAGEQALRQAVADVAAATDVGAVMATLDAAVPLLGTGRVTHDLRTAADYVSPSPPDVPIRTIRIIDVPPDAVAERLGGGPALAYSICHNDGNGLLSVYLQGNPAAIDRVWPRLDVLATQACLVLERIRLRGELVRRTIEEYINAVAQTSGNVILLVDDTDRIVLASKSAAAMFGTSDVVGVKLTDLVGEAVRPAATDLLWRARVRATPQPDGARGAALDRLPEAVPPPVNVVVEPPEGVDAATWFLPRSDGSQSELDVACRRVTSTEPSVRGLLVTIRDVTEQRRLERELTERASRDPLTGLVSGLLVREKVRQEIEAHRDALICMIILDIDDFKLINAQYGLDIGDAVLQTVAGRLTEALPPPGLVGRVAGDRFALVVDIDRPSDADEITGRLLDAVARPIDVDHIQISCTATAGVATTVDAKTSQELARQAELAFLVARDEGRGRWHVYDPTSRSNVIERLELRSALKHALEEHEFTVLYQPVVDLATGVVAGFEALLRWHHPTYGRLSPTAFIDVAEESRLIIPIGDWVLATAIHDARRWDSVASEPPFISVNVSPTQFGTPDFFDGIQRTLAANGVSASRLHLEITEGAVLSDEAVWGDLQRLRGMGIQVAIDDFGTGYSALSYLGRVPVDRIKLDRQFVASMTASHTQRDLVEGIVQLTRILELEVIAEGIETPEERDLAADVGCRYGQGYLFARPMPAEEITTWMAEHRERVAELASAGHPGQARGSGGPG
ncbi:MAG: EAL domain-containing protein [Micromonosporaceae bacterium]|nr:EAL domain-containing protein [Micromonosporaceae bacterium]